MGKGQSHRRRIDFCTQSIVMSLLNLSAILPQTLYISIRNSFYFITVYFCKIKLLQQKVSLGHFSQAISSYHWKQYTCVKRLGISAVLTQAAFTTDHQSDILLYFPFFFLRVTHPCHPSSLVFQKNHLLNWQFVFLCCLHTEWQIRQRGVKGNRWGLQIYQPPPLGS